MAGIATSLTFEYLNHMTVYVRWLSLLTAVFFLSRSRPWNIFLLSSSSSWSSSTNFIATQVLNKTSGSHSHCA